MTYLEAFLYGAVQGITEYLPVSSSAHLTLLPQFLGTRDPGLAFDVFLHFGTLMATLAYFWKEWHSIALTLPVVGKRKGEGGVDWLPIAIATVPALLAGALLHHKAETIFRGNLIQASTLVIGGVILYLSDLLARRDRPIESMGTKDALWIGIAQCFALVPGMSRSGSTISGARILGFDRAAAAKFSFLISAPVTAAAIVFELRKWHEVVNGPVGMGPLIVGAFSAFVFGCLAIGGLLRMMRRFGYLSFAVYRVLLAVIVLTVLGS